MWDRRNPEGEYAAIILPRPVRDVTVTAIFYNAPLAYHESRDSIFRPFSVKRQALSLTFIRTLHRTIIHFAIL